MADKKISQLVDGGAPQATDEFVVDRAGADNFKIDWASIKAEAESDAVLDGDAAGGVLSGTYPDPGFAADMATQAELDAVSTVANAAIPSLPDPNADLILFWDDSAGAYAYLTPGTNLTITGTTLDAAGGGSQSLAQVLVVGNDPDGTPIHGADFGGDLGANVTVGSGTEGSGGELRLESGSTNLIDGVGGSLIVESGGGYQGGLLAITAGGSAGDGSPGGDVDIDGGRADGAGADGGQVNFVGGVAGGDGVGGAARLVGGDSQGSGVASEIVLYGMPAVSGDGKIYFLTDGSAGNPGEFLGSDGAGSVVWSSTPIQAPTIAGGTGGKLDLVPPDGFGTGGEVLLTGGDGDASSGGAVSVSAGYGPAGQEGGTLSLSAGGGNGGSDPALFEFTGNGSGGEGGVVTAKAGSGEAGQAGGSVDLAGGDGDGGGGQPGGIGVSGGGAASESGRVFITTDGSGGADGELLTAQGDGSALWMPGSVVQLDEMLVTAGTTASADFVSIPGTFRHLWLICQAIGSTAGASDCTLAFNNDTTDGNYRRNIVTDGGAASAASDRLCGLVATKTTALCGGAGEIMVPNYANATAMKHARAEMSYQNDSDVLVVRDGGLLWESTAAISRITITPTSGAFNPGSRITLYGIS